MQEVFTRKTILLGALALFGLIVIFIGALILLTPTSKAPEEQTVPVIERVEVIGTSTLGRTISAYTYGTGTQQLLFVGGMHGGYEWNSVLLAYQAIDYFEANPNSIPSNISLTVIPSLNPDGLYEVVGKEGRFVGTDASTDATTLASGRFNANDVDLNRNFDCKWQATSTWRNSPVSAGVAPFSEPEAVALRDYILRESPSVVVFWHSQGSAVYASECHNGILPDTLSVMNAYALASGYRAVSSFDAYPITGDAEGWLASINIPALTVELSTRTSVEWEKNLAGIKALVDLYQARP